MSAQICDLITLICNTDGKNREMLYGLLEYHFDQAFNRGENLKNVIEHLDLMDKVPGKLGALLMSYMSRYLTYEQLRIAHEKDAENKQLKTRLALAEKTVTMLRARVSDLEKLSQDQSNAIKVTFLS